MTSGYIAPSFNLTGFHCPFCHVYAHQAWGSPAFRVGSQGIVVDQVFHSSYCRRCRQLAIWVDESMVYPRLVSSPHPNPDLSEGIAADFQEARQIVQQSPRGAAALLRLAIQKLCVELGQPGKNLNADIGALVAKGLPIKVQQALDIVRVVGNQAVHPGQIDRRDDRDTADKLFGLVNLICEILISQPKQVEALYGELVPEEQRKAIEGRDGGAAAK